MKKWLVLFEAGCAFSALWVVLLFCYYASPPSESDLWDISTAIGTVGAVVIAVGLATRDERRRRKVAFEVAALTAVSASHTLDHVVSILEAVQRSIRRINESDMNPAAFKEILEQLKYAPQWNVKDLLPLTPLANNCAHKLAAGFECQRKAVELLKLMIRNRKHLTLDGRKKICVSLYPILAMAITHHTNGRHECRKAAGDL